jgi:hypothetical protein
MWGALSDERMGLPLTIAAGPRQQSFLGLSPARLMTIFYSLRFETPTWRQAPVFISSRNRVAQLYPQVLGSLFVASYDFQGNGGDIRTCLYAGLQVLILVI